MPLDGRNWKPETETKPDKGDIGLKPDLSKPSLEGLSWLLRHPEEWPREDFVWNFADVFAQRYCERPLVLRRLFGRGAPCGTAGCSIGLCITKWKGCQLNYHLHGADEMAIDAGQRWFGLSRCTANELFTFCGYVKQPVLPCDVADRIDAYLAETRK